MKLFKTALIALIIISQSQHAFSNVDTTLFKFYAPFAQTVQYFTGIPASVQLAQAFNETGFGAAGPGQSCNNWFSIKDYPLDYWPQSCQSWNWNKTKMVNWRHYESGLISWIDYAYFIYFIRPKNLNKDWKEWVKYPIKYGGRGYWRRIGTTIERYNLSQYDLNFRA